MAIGISQTLLRACAWRLVLWVLIFAGCSEDDVIPPRVSDAEVIYIPVVVHVVYSNPVYNISDEKIKSQIQVLNEDFNLRNGDRHLIPPEFKSLAANIGIEFRLATVDPTGKPTNGVTRTSSQVSGWDGVLHPDTSIEELRLYFTALGGQDAWPTDRYLNIWVSELSNRFDELGMAGYAHLPGKTDPRIDGVVIDPRAFGTIEPLALGHRGGRTATHEVGHWLNLKHIFGVDSNCASLDEVADTPAAAQAYQGTPSYPQHSCGSSDMFMNFMDLVDDDAMHLFTLGQRERMRANFHLGGARRALYENNRGATFAK